MFAPVWDTQHDVQMVGIFRLTYRPNTRLTTEWYQRLQYRVTEWMSVYEKIGPLWKEKYRKGAR